MMERRVRQKHWALAGGAMAIAALWSCSASATLGEPESSVGTETQLRQGSITESDHGRYRVHEIRIPSGTLVREYASPDGNVFAVTWRGPFVPNLKQTLGRYFDEYAAAARTAHGDRKHLEMRQSDLVVQVSGHMRAFAGRAYLPQAMPSGVVVGDLE